MPTSCWKRGSALTPLCSLNGTLESLLDIR
jgi:hypothetical protein